MGRFEKRPDNPRPRGDLSRAAENALWDVVDDLENLQQNVLKSLQEDLKRLENQKSRLLDDVEQLTTEVSELKHSRQIAEQQVLIRQLAEALAKHISSQLQSSLQSLVTETQASPGITLKSAEVNTAPNREINEMLSSLGDNINLVFNSLLRELKDHQSNLSQQLLRMYDQQEEGESIFREFVNRLRWELERTKESTGLNLVTGGSPTILQQPLEPITTPKLPPKTQTTSEPISVLRNDFNNFSESESIPPKAQITSEPISVLRNDFNNFSEPESTPPKAQTTSEPISILRNEFNNFSESESIPPEPIPQTPEPAIDLTSVLRTNSSQPPSSIAPTPIFKHNFSTRADTELLENSPEPISVFKTELYHPPATPPPKPTNSANFLNWSQIQVGFWLITLSTVVSGFYNIAIKVIFYQSSESMGEFALQGLVLPTLGNIFFVLMIRLTIVAPLMFLLAPILHPPVWQELKTVLSGSRSNGNHGKDQVLQWSILSGGFLFLSQVLFYIAIIQLKTGIAIALFFIYPILSLLLSSIVLRENLNFLSSLAIATMIGGEVLVLNYASSDPSNTILENTTAILSGAAFAVYVILTKLCANQLHPVSLSAINSVTMLALSFICFMIPLPDGWNLALNPDSLLEIILSALMLGVLTLCIYLLNNFGIRQLGSPLAAIIGAAVPIVTVILAGLILQENLDFTSILGILLLTFGAAMIGLEKMQSQIKSTNSTK